MQSDLLYKDKVYQIIGAAIDVHRELGYGFLESVYEEAMTIESNRRSIPHETQVRIPIYYKGKTLEKEFIADYVGFEKIIAEFKCVPQLAKTEKAQIINYLKATGMEVDLLINFGSKGKLEWERFVFTSSSAKNIKTLSEPSRA